VNRPNPRSGGVWASWSLSILLHLAIVAIAVGAWFWAQRSRPPEPMGIQGSVVSSTELARLSEPLPDSAPVASEPEPVPEPEPEPLPVPEEPPPPVEDPAVLQAEADRVAEERRVVEARQAAEAKAREEAARQQAERERRDKERAEQEKLERERLARERTERERREREEAERNQREAELAQQLAAEQQRAAVRGSAQARQYADQIRTRIERAWVRPPSARVGLACEVRVTQSEAGTVLRVRIGSCNGDDAVRQSIEAAVFRASPLPLPTDPALFERELIFNFAPEN
jgi:colicin import membrane protein